MKKSEKIKERTKVKSKNKDNGQQVDFNGRFPVRAREPGP
jgi:hypothetical protein